MKPGIVFILLAFLMLKSEAQSRFVVYNRYNGKNQTYSLGTKFIFSTRTDTMHARRGTIVKITKDSLYLDQDTVRFSNIHTIYKKERWKKRLIYFSVINVALLIPQFTTSNEVVANMLFIPWFCSNLYFATTGLHHAFSSKELFHLPNDSEIIIVY